MRKCFILAVLLLMLQLAACGITETQQHIVPDEPEPTPEPVLVYMAERKGIDSGLSVLEPVCASEDGFYLRSVEKSGEEIPEAVVREAKRKNREPYNDGRYDILTPKLWLLDEDGELTQLDAYTLPESAENTEGWRSWSCVPGFEAMREGKDDTLLSLEYNVISGNSAPPRRADMVIGKNYLEYHVLWILRTLSQTGEELESISLEGGREEALAALEKAAASPSETAAVSEVPFSWEKIGIDPQDVCSDIVKTAAGDYRFIIGRDGAEAVVTVKAALKEADKTALVLMTDNPSELLQDAVSAFNAGRDDVYITVAELDAAAEGLSADLFYLPLQTCLEMGRKGMLADLYPFLDADTELSRENYFANILASLEVNGALYSTCSGVSFRTVIGASSLVGDTAGWTYDELRDCWGSLGIGSDAFDAFTTCEDVMEACLAVDLGSFIDFDTGSCTFESDRFEKLLWFSGNFPREIDFDSHSRSDADSTDLRIRRGKQMLMEKQVYNFRDAVYCGYEYPERISFIGYPTLSGTGNAMSVSTLDTGMNFSMSASAELQEEAWAFLRTFFTEEFQEEIRFFPVNTAVFNRKMNEAMAVDYVLDAKGNITRDKAGEPVIRSIDTMYLSNYAQVSIFPLTENKAAKVVDLVSSTTKLVLDNADIVEVVMNSIRGYYTGSLSLTEAASAAQHAVTEYISY